MSFIRPTSPGTSGSEHTTKKGKETQKHYMPKIILEGHEPKSPPTSPRPQVTFEPKSPPTSPRAKVTNLFAKGALRRSSQPSIHSSNKGKKTVSAPRRSLQRAGSHERLNRALIPKSAPQKHPIRCEKLKTKDWKRLIETQERQTIAHCRGIFAAKQMRFECKEPGYFISILDNIAADIINEFSKIILKNRLQAVKTLFEFYEDGSAPDWLKKLYDSKTFIEFTDRARDIPQEDKRQVGRAFGGKKVIKTMEEWISQKKKDDLRLKLYLYYRDPNGFTAQQLPSNIPVQQRSHGATAQDLSSIRQRSVSLTRNNAKETCHKLDRKEKKSKGSLIKSNDSQPLVSTPQIAERQTSEHSTPKEESKKCLDRIKAVLKKAAHSGNKRDTLLILQSPDGPKQFETMEITEWVYNVEKNWAETIAELIFSKYLAKLHEAKNFEACCELVEEIVQQITNEWLVSPKELLKIFKDGRQPDAKVVQGLGDLLDAISLKDFLSKFDKLIEGDDKKIILLSLGGNKVMSALRDALRDAESRVIKEISEIARLERAFATDFFKFPKEMSIPQLTNGLVIRQWFPSSECIVENLYFNERKIEFETRPSPTKPYSEMSQEELREDACNELSYRKKNMEIVLEAICPSKKDLVAKLFDNKDEVCEIKELNLQSIEMTKAVTDALMGEFSSLNSSFLFKKVDGSYKCHYETVDDSLVVSFEKYFEIHHFGMRVGSFRLNWRYPVIDLTENHVKVECLISDYYFNYDN